MLKKYFYNYVKKVFPESRLHPTQLKVMWEVFLAGATVATNEILVSETPKEKCVEIRAEVMREVQLLLFVINAENN